jgi:hypothetical protein
MDPGSNEHPGSTGFLKYNFPQNGKSDTLGK